MTNINNKLITLKYRMTHIERQLENRIITAKDREELEGLYLEILQLEDELQNKINNNNLTANDLGVKIWLYKPNYAILVDCYKKSMYNVGGELTLLNERERKVYKDNNRIYVKINGVRVYQ